MKKVILTILIIFIIFIYVDSIFYTYLNSFRSYQTWSLLFFVIIYPLALVFTFWSLFLKTKKKNKIIFFISSLLLIVFSLLFRGTLIRFSDNVNFFLTKSSIMTFNNKINNNGNIKAMSNFEMPLKFINDYYVTCSKEEVDTTNSNYHLYYWKDILAKEDIDSTKFKEFENCLIENRLLLFSRNDNFTEFIINGNSGIIYSNLEIDELKKIYLSRYPRVENPLIRKVCKDWYVF